ncbi:hypothetical protein GJ744_011985 [Endocarpon pusillum]|uniref:BTB domain-containing protein n=1 Tax=Endocarpon pusillum TaxID=364733 RepID=A0A8H7ARF2_9EURO|nr:hypothetical protein GJ744_011985 [Endocarpon pusillum]
MTSLLPPDTPSSEIPMVSRPEVADHSRRAGSVVSRTTRSRHHRGRSHHGGSSYQPQNEFPFFAQTGDVEIVISADGQEKKYLLHRLILAQCSGFFEAGTSAEWSQASNSAPRPENALARIGEDEEEPAPVRPTVDPQSINAPTSNRKRWRYELDWDHADADEDPMLVQKTPSSGSLFNSDFQPTLPPPRSKPPAAHSGGFFRSMANLTLGAQSTSHLPSIHHPQDQPITNPILRDYDNLFRIFYNYAPSLNPTYLPSAYSECKALLALADLYDALPVVGPRIDHHLLRFSSRLFKQIAKYPPSYLKLGYLARSRIIFAEALVHVVGRWPLDRLHLQGDNIGYEVPESVIELIEDKVDELEEMKAKVEAKLFRLTLTTSRGERVHPGNDYLGWLAMSLFRQWLAENTTPPVQGILRSSATPPASRVQGSMQHPSPSSSGQRPSHPPPPPPVPSPMTNTGRVYRALGSTNSQSYLPRDELKRFLKFHPSSTSSSSSSSALGSLYNRENLRRFERKVDEVKNLARDVVKPLTRNFLELDVRTGDGASGSMGEGASLVQYLTCTKVEEGEVPWDY